MPVYQLGILWSLKTQTIHWLIWPWWLLSIDNSGVNSSRLMNSWTWLKAFILIWYVSKLGECTDHLILVVITGTKRLWQLLILILRTSVYNSRIKMCLVDMVLPVSYLYGDFQIYCIARKSEPHLVILMWHNLFSDYLVLMFKWSNPLIGHTLTYLLVTIHCLQY